jgi:hypothetical protein
VSIVNLKRAVGILMQSERIQANYDCSCGLPQYKFHKDGSPIEALHAPILEAVPVEVEYLPTPPTASTDLQTAPDDDEYLQTNPFESELVETGVIEAPDQAPNQGQYQNPSLLNRDQAPVLIDSLDLARPETRP